MRPSPFLAPFLGLLLFSHTSLAASTSTGATSPEEARYLWVNSKRLFEIGDYRRASTLLERFVDRYPGYTGYLEAHCLLGQSFLELGKAKEALTPLRFCVGRTSNSSKDGALARLWLGRAYLETKKFDEAFLTALEIENMGVGRNTEIHVETLVLKTLALLGLRQLLNAKNASDSAQKIITEVKTLSTKVLGHWSAARLVLKTQECAQFPTPGLLTELQVKDQMNRRGICLQEALLFFRDTFETKEKKSVERVSHDFSIALKDFSFACGHPSIPPEPNHSKRTVVQLKIYLDEMKRLLRQECLKHLQTAQKILLGFESQIPASFSKHYKGIALQIETLITVNSSGDFK